ncbi:prolipoprotein diacylglyceryl transferase [Aquimarina mytili]|uniref:Prolipoprotein diacylglyceryl transferase n=1 Tax=Aquimarina mytili TaxID=874423 RepID=A0A936ZZ59_9FLAO|nr:prolipoprotein diacylglyceryl transferase family protein [Aquimarina mytili]MBL0683836.1 prolipoprotein diacylglyceryl transferase [Aquimarina mytili]
MRFTKLHIKFFNFQISTFHLLGVFGYIFGVLLGVGLAKQVNIQPGIIIILALISMCAFFLLVHISKWLTGQEILVYYHHEISILFFCAVVLYLLKVPILPYLDITLLGVGTFLFFGRIGCHLVGCCHGSPCKYGITYGKQHVEAGFTWYYQNVKLFPVQLIESVYVGAIVGIGCILIINETPPGTVLILYSVFYGLFRFIIEFFRGDPERPLWLGISEAQWTTMILIFITLGFSYLGWLPLYIWHNWVMLILGIIVFFRIIYYYYNESFKIITYKGIKELADGLATLDNLTQNSNSTEGKINIYKTINGFSISIAKEMNNNDFYYCYTISYKKELSSKILRKIALNLKTLRKHYSTFTILRKQNFIYHIVFKDCPYSTPTITPTKLTPNSDLLKI